MQPNELAKSVGFDDVNDFLNYCVAHSKTSRALFHAKHIGACQILAGYTDVGTENMQQEGWASCDLRELVAEARAEARAIEEATDASP